MDPNGQPLPQDAPHVLVQPDPVVLLQQLHALRQQVAASFEQVDANGRTQNERNIANDRAFEAQHQRTMSSQEGQAPLNVATNRGQRCRKAPWES